jgi:poly [ADP-ribose] polymerase
VLRPANAVISGKMFGYGLYFADKFRKSLNYSSLYGSYWARGNAHKAYLAVYEVHTGTQLHVKHHEPWCGLLTEERLKAKGQQYDSVFAEGGADLVNNEYIVYNEAQCTIKYLVEVTC